MAFYAEVAEAKDRLEPYRDRFAGFTDARGLRVLEIGVGLGVDLVRFAAAGATVTGVDLTEAAIEATRENLDLRGLAGDLQVADAADLPFADDAFDVVYSWGVLHHAHDAERAVAEMRRVLRSGGEARVMLYARRSWFASAVWLRQIAREARPLQIGEAVGRGLESPGTRAYTIREAERLFNRWFIDTRIRQVATAYDRRVAGPFAVDGLGWHLLVRAH